MATKQKWIDLAAHGIYLGDQKMADGKQRLVVLDMNGRGDPEKLKGVGLVPLQGSPRYAHGIYFLQGDDQRLRPKLLAHAFGLDSCPLVEVDRSEIVRVFREKTLEKFGANIQAVLGQSKPLGKNRAGRMVFETPMGRVIRVSKHNAVLEGSAQAKSLNPSSFLRASDETQLRACAEGFLWTVREGGKTNWTDVVRFARTVYGHLADGEPSDEQLHRLQEAIEAASYRRFMSQAQAPTEAAFKLATDFYYGLPVARMRTAQSVFLQQYSTPLPMSVIAQRLLTGSDELIGKSVLEPTAGNGGLVNLLPESVRVYGVELDAQRLDALKESGRITALHGDATNIDFERVFSEPQGFDYTIANPPFGQMERPQAFDKIPSVRRQDHYIALRTLAARKDQGRSVLILGADSSQSDGTVKGGASHFLNYVYDHYQVHGLVEVDGRMYSRHGSGYNVRMLVVGDRRAAPAAPGEVQVPTQLKILTSYDELWQWGEQVLESYPDPALAAQQLQGDWVSVPDIQASPVFGAGDRARIVLEGDSPKATLGSSPRRPSVAELFGIEPERERSEPQGQVQGETRPESPQQQQESGPETKEAGKQTRQLGEREGPDGRLGETSQVPLDGAAVVESQYHYGLMTRPAGPLTALPEGHVSISFARPQNPWHAAVSAHGVVTYSRKLTADEVAKAEISVLIQDEASMGRVIDAFIVRELDTYGRAYADLVHSGEQNAQALSEELAPRLRAFEAKHYGGPVAFESEAVKSERLIAALLTRYPKVEAQLEQEATSEEIPSEQDGESVNELLPWQMLQAQWEAAVAAGDAARVAQLHYGVQDWAQEKVQAQQRGELVLEGGELEDVTERLNMPVTHRDVIEKALAEGHEVPALVLAEYPDMEIADDRRVNEFQAPYQAASRVGEPSTMIPINMSGATYAALNALETRVGPVDEFVARKLQYPLQDLGGYFSPEQVDALALGINALDQGRGIINADQTGVGKGRYVAGLLRYTKLQGKTPIFLTITPELFTDIFRDISDIGSQELFKKLFIFNDGVNIKKFGTESEVLYRATTPGEREAALRSGQLEPDVDLVLATYSQFMRAYSKNRKAQLLTEIAANDGVMVLDESHVAAGSSNLGATVQQAVSNSAGTMYASATPLKGVENFALYSKVFPASVDLKTLPDTLRAGGEALQEAISANMARDGVLIRRELDFSDLVFHTRHPAPDREIRNRELADKLAEIVSGLGYLAGDVARTVADLNKGYKKEWEGVPESDRNGARMQASSMNFGSRLYNLNRQFLLGIKIEDAVQTALEDLANGRKPVIAVENTGESLLRQVLARRLGIDSLEAELAELDERAGALSAEEQALRDTLVTRINESLQSAVLDDPPQYRELLEIMLDRIGMIKIQGRYGDVQRVEPESKEYKAAAEALREKIRAFPDLPLTPIDVIKKELNQRGFPMAEVSGRKASLVPLESDSNRWDVQFHAKSDAVANVAGFQNGKYEAIVITRSGSTGISLHATDRFEDSDIRQRNFIVAQKAANIAEFLQWMGRVNRKGQVVSPRITSLESGLPAELRTTMMHNAKLRRLSANTTSNRQNANLEGDEFDLLNDVGERVALDWLLENPDTARDLDIDLPEELDERDDTNRFSQDCPYINKLMGRLLMVSVAQQEEILRAITVRFADKLDELTQRGVNPFRVDVFDWGAQVVHEEELQSGVIRTSGSTFDEPVKLVTLRYEQEVKPIRADRLMKMISVGEEMFVEAMGDRAQGVSELRDQLKAARSGWVRKQLPAKLRESEEPLETILAGKDVAGAKMAAERADWLLANLQALRPGVPLTHEDPFAGERTGVIVSVDFPKNRDELFLLSKYRARVAFPGEDKVRDITLATVRNQEQDLRSQSWKRIDPKGAVAEHIQRHVNHILDAFNSAPDGLITRTQYVLRGNIFRACELAHEQGLGAPVLFTDDQGNRQRGVLLKDRITPDMVKALPIGLDAADICDYIDEYLDPSHPRFRERSTFGEFCFYDSGVKDMKKGDGIMFEVLNGGGGFRLTIPGTKSRAGALMSDGEIFDIGSKSPHNSLKLKLAGTRSHMQVDIPRADMPALLEVLQRNRHVGKFYLPVPDHEILQRLKDRYSHALSSERESDMEMTP